MSRGPQPAGFFAVTAMPSAFAPDEPGSGATSTKHRAWPGLGAAHAARYPDADAGPEAPLAPAGAAGESAAVSEAGPAGAPPAGMTSSAARCAAVSRAAATAVCVANALMTVSLSVP